MNALPRCSPSFAVERTRLLYGSYIWGDAADPDTFMAAAAAVFATYPESVVRSATDPVTGMARKHKRRPEIAEIYEACEERMRPLLDEQARDRRRAETHLLLAGPPPEPKKSIEELQAACGGPNWGIKLMTDLTPAEERQRRNDQMIAANQTYIQRELKAAGINDGLMLSLDMRKKLAAIAAENEAAVRAQAAE